MLCAQEIGLGILVYTLVTILLWLSGTWGELDSAVREPAATQHANYRHYRKLFAGQEVAEDTHGLRIHEVQQFTRLSQALAAARTDSYQALEVRRQWRQVQRRSAGVMETLEPWRESFAEVKDLDFDRLFPTMEALGEELDRRFGHITRMLEGKPPEGDPQVVDLPLDADHERVLSHFQKAAVAVTCGPLAHLDEITRPLFESLADIKGFGTSNQQPSAADALGFGSVSGFVLDPDRIAATIRAMASSPAGGRRRV